MSSPQPQQTPFHRLLSFFATRSPHPNQSTITFTDSLRGDLSVGLNLPLALVLALARHLVFRTAPISSLLSPDFSIRVPDVRSQRRLLAGPGIFDIDAARDYSLRELLRVVARGDARVDGGGGLGRLGALGRRVVPLVDAVGVWALAADGRGLVRGADVRAFQKGEVMEGLVERRRFLRNGGHGNVLPFWRGGPIW